MTECYIVLAFLLKRDEPALWKKYRNYGSGQAKLAFLKNFDLDKSDMPDYFDVSELEAMANEEADIQSFEPSDLGPPGEDGDLLILASV